MNPCPPRPLPARKVFITEQQQPIMTVVTNDQGRFSVRLPAGLYQVAVTLVGIEWSAYSRSPCISLS